MKYPLLALSMLLASLFFSGCRHSKVDETTIVIVTTGNVHGALLPYDFKADTVSYSSLANISSYIKDIRNIYGASNVLTLDAGGSFTGSVEAYYFNFIDTITEPLYYRALRYIDYDAYGIAQSDLQVDECLHPRRIDPNWHPTVVCANMLNTLTKRAHYQPYTIVYRGKAKIAILGLTSPEVKQWLPKMQWKNIMTTDMVECAQEWVDYIRKVEKPDLLIGMFQCSRNYTANGYELNSYKNPNGGIPVVKMVDGFDLVILGKDQQPASYKVVNDFGHTVPVFNVGILASNVALTTVHFEDQPDGSVKKIIHTAITPADENEVDSEYFDLFKADYNAIKGWVTQKIGYFDDTCNPYDDYMYQSSYRHFINDAQLWYTGADVSIAGIFTREHHLPAGDVFMSSLLYYYSYENEIMKLRMTGEEIDRFLEYTYAQQYAQMDDPSDYLLNLLTEPTSGGLARDPEGHPYLSIPFTNFFEAGGLRYVVDVSKPHGNRVEILSLSDGRNFNPRADYSVAINSFHGSGGDEVLYHAIGWNSETLQLRTLPIRSIHIREVLNKYLSTIGRYTFTPSTDWKIIPESWIQKVKERQASGLPSPIYSNFGKQ